jgi:CRISPR-associated protein Cmr5
MAFEHVGRFKDRENEDKKKYASMVHAMPTLLRSAGLSQALHFVASRSDKHQRSLLEDFAKQLHRVNARITDGTALLERARSADLDEYMRLTQEALACASWYRRMVQAVLKVDMADTDRRG